MRRPDLISDEFKLQTSKGINYQENKVDKLDNSVYSGYTLKDKPFGPGTKVMRSGIQFEGFFRDGKMHGVGHMINYDREGKHESVFILEDG